MTPEPSNEPEVLNDKPMSAWDSAAAMGIDMSLIERNLRLSVEDRLLQNDSRLSLFLILEQRAELNPPAPVKSS